MEIRDVMTESVVSAPAAASVREIAELMRDRNVGSVVLADADDHPIAIITDRDLAITVVADARESGSPAADYASAPLLHAEPGMDIEQAAGLMVRHGIRRLPVLDGERLAGIVTLDDLAVRIGDVALAARMTSQITRAALPDFYFHDRGG